MRHCVVMGEVGANIDVSVKNYYLSEDQNPYLKYCHIDI